ncbi:MAG: 50S ribosomal protein L18 [Acidilobaceae archaeon]|nr:50S ribosomal protein L18 [Acidilobaceae archaeon]
MARGPTYRVPWRRKREGKTNYYKRLKLIKSGKPRMVVRISLNYVTVQFVEARPEGDRVIAAAHSRELYKHYGWLGGGKNTCASYLTGLLAAFRARAKGVSEAVLDIGLRKPTKGGRVFAAMKGALDAGIQVPHSPEVLPTEDRLACKHIAEWAKSIGEELYKRQFSKYLSRGFRPEDLPSHVREVASKIRAEYEARLQEVKASG